MLRVYPFASGSLYTASNAVTASYAESVDFIYTVITSSYAEQVLELASGSRGKGVCLITAAQYQQLLNNPNIFETCTFTS